MKHIQDSDYQTSLDIYFELIMISCKINRNKQ